jgi:hypothetical protein
VRPGDDLVIGQAKPSTPTTFAITATIPGNVLPQASEFWFASTCMQSAGLTTNLRTNSLDLVAGCTSADFYAELEDDHLNAIGTFYQHGQAVAPGTTVTLSGPFTPAVTTTLAVTHVPDLTTVTPAVDLAVGAFYPMSMGLATELTLSGGAGMRSYPIAVIPGSAVESRVFTQSLGSQLYVARQAAPGSTTLDVSTMLAVPTGASYDATSSSVAWMEQGQPDSALASLIVRSGTARDFQRVVLGPDTVGLLHVPRLPPSLAMFDVMAGDQVTVAEVDIAKLPGGYDRVRHEAFAHGVDGGNQVLWFSPFYGSDRRSGLDYTPNIGDVAILASTTP